MEAAEQVHTIMSKCVGFLLINTDFCFSVIVIVIQLLCVHIKIFVNSNKNSYIWHIIEVCFDEL